MYKIHPVEEKIIAKSIWPELSENEILFVVNEDGKFTGNGICEITNSVVYLKFIKAPYDDARVLMFLAMLNYAEKKRGRKSCLLKRRL